MHRLLPAQQVQNIWLRIFRAKPDAQRLILHSPRTRRSVLTLPSLPTARRQQKASDQRPSASVSSSRLCLGIDEI
jgi:hypothetical protein